MPVCVMVIFNLFNGNVDFKTKAGEKRASCVVTKYIVSCVFVDDYIIERQTKASKKTKKNNNKNTVRNELGAQRQREKRLSSQNG